MHWFPIEATFEKMSNILNDDGVVGVYGYMLLDIRGENGEKIESYTNTYREFEEKVIHSDVLNLMLKFL